MVDMRNEVRNLVRHHKTALQQPDDQQRRNALIALSAALLEVGVALRLIVEDADEIRDSVVKEAVEKWKQCEKSAILNAVLRDSDGPVEFKRI